MKQHWALTGVTAISFATALSLATAQAQPAPGGGRGGAGPGVSVGGGGGGGGGAIRGGGPGRGGPGGGAMVSGPGRGPGPMVAGGGARIDSRIRSGAIDRRVGGAPPLTIGGARYSAANRYYYSGRRYPGGRYYYPGGYYRSGWYDDGWFPGALLAAPFLLPWALFGGADYDYGGGYYDPYYGRNYSVSVGYGGPVSGPAAPLGNYCATPQKVCLLYQPAEVGVGCSCRAPAGLPRFRGAVVP